MPEPTPEPTLEPTLAQDLLLLLLDDETGKPTTDGTSLDYALGGALLLELAIDGRIDVTPGRPRSATVTVLDGAPTGDDLLDGALRLVAERPRRADQLVPELSKGLRRRLLAGAAERGLVRSEPDRLLGIFPRERWPAVDRAREQEQRRRLHDVLVLGTAPDARTAALVALLSSIGAAHRVVGELDRTTRKAVRKRAKDIAEAAWAAEAVRRAVEAVQAAVTVSVVAATAATAASSS